MGKELKQLGLPSALLFSKKTLVPLKLQLPNYPDILLTMTLNAYDQRLLRTCLCHLVSQDLLSVLYMRRE
jgi:hypothetical protein